MCYSCWIWIIHVHIYRYIMFWLKWSKMRNKLFIHHIEHECIHVCIILFFYWNELKYLIIFLLKWNKMKELFIIEFRYIHILNGFEKPKTRIRKCRNEFVFIYFNLFSFTRMRAICFTFIRETFFRIFELRAAAYECNLC